MKRIGLTQLTILVSITLATRTEGQQWQLGHQPPRHTVPQYHPGVAHPQMVPQEEDQPSRYPLYEAIPEPSRSSNVPRVEEIPAANQLLPLEPAPLVPHSATATNPAIAFAPSSSQIRPRYGLDYSIYRNYSPYPIDPRKPCNECTQGNPKHGLCPCQWPGKHGRPYQDREPGGCECAKDGNRHCDRFSVNWPAPFSVLRDSHSHHLDPCNALRPRINDRFNHLESFKLVDYRRTDNGYCGFGADPYGCLGESRVMGVGFRSPGTPVAIPAR